VHAHDCSEQHRSGKHDNGGVVSHGRYLVRIR
jgi:hypothetical protein